MRWIRRSLIALLLLMVLAVVLFLAILLYSYRYVTHVPVSDPAIALLDRGDSPTSRSAGPPPWLRQARLDRDAPLMLAEFELPPQRFGPWTRWWWPGNLVESSELRREMRLFDDVGIAGVEIQPFAISLTKADVRSDRWQDSGWDSPEFYENLHTVLNEALLLGMEVDLNNGSGWPTGGPHVGLADGMRQLVHSEHIVTGPAQIAVSLNAPRIPLGAFMAGAVGMLGETPMQAFVADTRQIVAVVAARVLENQRTWEPWDLQDQITLDITTRIDITAMVEEGVLHWAVPPGEWAITALWQMPGGELISGGYAHPNPGYVVDHLDARRVRANQDYLFRSETGLNDFYGRPLRGFFNDSLEFRQERHWARGHLASFEKRLGYDPRPWLAALVEPGKDQMPFHALNVKTRPAYKMGPLAKRFLEDWDQVVSDLFHERYLQPMQEWAVQRELAHRSQAYGGPIDVIRAAGETDIPETEQLYAGGSEMFLKAVASGAHIAGKPIVSAESFVFMGRAFMTTPLKIKALADKALAAGVNQIVFHGTSYQIKDHDSRGYPVYDGWYPWQLGNISTDYSENWEYWRYAGRLNRYIARNQYLLRKGRVEVDVVVLYPGLGFPQGYFNAEEPFDRGNFPGEEIGRESAERASPGSDHDRMRELWRMTSALEAKGLTWAWVNEHALERGQFREGVLHIGDLRASALRLHAIEALHPDVAEHILSLELSGLPVHITGGRPNRQHGLSGREAGDDRVRDAMSRVRSSAQFPPSVVRYSNAVVKSLRRRLPEGGIIQFFSNPTSARVLLDLEIEDSFPSATFLDAWQGRFERHDTSMTGGKLRYSLPPYGSVSLWLQPEPSAGLTRSVTHVEERLKLEDWSLLVGDTPYKRGAALGDWLDHAVLRDSGGPGRYTTEFSLSAEQLRSVGEEGDIAVELGTLYGAAEVTLNGVSMGSALVPPYRVSLREAAIAGENTLEVRVIVPRKNRLVEEMTSGAQGWFAPEIVQFDSRVSAGLVGPVSLILERIE